MRSSVSRFVVLVALLASLPGGASAQPPPPTTPTEPVPATEPPADATTTDEAPAADIEDEAATDVSPETAAETTAVEAEVEVVAAEEPAASSPLSDFLASVAIHGFGNYGAGVTRVRRYNTNHYQFGDHDGDFGHVNFSLRQLVQPIPELRFAAGQSFSVDDGELEIELDLAGAQWTPNRYFSLRAGRILSPLGIYTEVFRVGTLRPFGALPSAIYANAGFIAQSYDGAELAFTLESESGWRARLSAIVGRSRIEQDGSISRVVEAAVGYPIGLLRTRVVMDLMAGGHVAIDTPVEGLGFAYGLLGASPRYTDLIGDDSVAQNWNNIVMIGSAYFLRDSFELRTEIAYRYNHDREATGTTAPTLQKTYGLYIEAAYRIIDSVQVGLRFERMKQNLAGGETLYPRRVDGEVVGSYESIEHSNDLGAVISYWWNRDFVLKLEYHFIDGNRFAHPGDQAIYDAVLAGRPLARRTHYVGFSSAFSF